MEFKALCFQFCGDYLWICLEDRIKRHDYYMILYSFNEHNNNSLACYIKLLHN